MRDYRFNDLAGCVEQRRSRLTRHMVGLYHADQAQLDSSAGPWATICEEHGHIINHDTLALARSHLGEPPRVLRRLFSLRGLSHEQEVEPVFT